MLLGHVCADLVSDLFGTALGRVAVVVEAVADAVEQDVGPLTDRRVGEVEPCRQSVARTGEVLVDRRDPTAKLSEPLAGRRIAREQSLRVGVVLHGVDGRRQLGWHHSRHRRPPVVDREHRHRRSPGPLHRMQDEVADRQHRHRVEAVMLIRHVGQPLDALVELIAQALVVECGQIDVGQLTVARDRCRLELVVPTLQHVPPDPLFERRCRNAGATADLGAELLGRFRAVRPRHVERDGLHVHEPVDVHHVHRVEQRAPPRQRLCEPAAHPRRIRRLHQRRHRRRQVGTVLHPGPRPRRDPLNGHIAHVHPSDACGRRRPPGAVGISISVTTVLRCRSIAQRATLPI